MSDYARLILSLEVSESSDYSDPYLKPRIPAFTLTPDEVEWKMIEAHTTAVTVDLSAYTTINYLIVINDSSTVDVAVTYTTATNHVAAGAAVRHDVLAGRFNVYTDVDPAAANLTLDSESSTTHRCYVGIIGA